MWAGHGHSVDRFVHTDLRVLGLGVATWIVAATCHRPFSELDWWLPLLALPVAAKGFAIWASNLFVIGANDRLQASIVGTPSEGHRVILIGGDTFLILVPAIALLALARVQGTRLRALLALSALSALGGLLLSATRTGFVIAIALIVGVGCVALVRRRWVGLSRGTVIVGVVCLLFVAGGAWATGLVHRLGVHDAPHSGIRVRTDEVRTFTHLPPQDVLFGQGFGGRFETLSALNQPTVSGWSHVLPVWIGLKVGLLGIAAALAMLVLLLRRAPRLLRLGGPPAREAALGVAITSGMIVMSLTIDRAALPEGVPVLALGLALIPERPR
jgi:hypothetical protein